MADTRAHRRPSRRAPSSPASVPRSTPISTTIAAALIVLATLGAYANSFDGIFVFDDEPSIQHNPFVRSIWPLTRSMAAPVGSTLAGRPIASLSFAIDYVRAGGHALAAYHATNLAIHIGAALLLFGVTRRTLRVPRLATSFGPSATPLAFAVALLWALHPVQTGSVTYIVQRVESLMGLLYLATLYCAIRARDAPPARRAWWLVTSIAACAVGMGTKEVMATAPLAVLTWDYLFGSEQSKRPRWFYPALACCWIILAILVAGGPRSFSVGFHFDEWPWWRYLFTQARVVVHYLRLSVFPWPLVLDYEWTPATFAQALAPGLLVLALVAATVWALLRRAPAAFPGIWFFAILAPTSTIVPIVTEVAAEHRLYLPVAAPIALAVLGAFALGRRVSSISARASYALAYGPVIIAAALFAVLTHQRNEDYADYDRIWSQTISARPRNTRALNNYATSLMAQGRFGEAEQRLRTALEVNPAFAEAEANLGVSLCAQGRFDDGVSHLQRAIALDPDRPSAYRNLAEAYGSQGQMAAAVEHYSRALALAPDDVELLNRVAWILATTPDDRLRDPARARAHAERAVTLTGREDPVSLDSLAASLAASGDFGGAVTVAAEALAAARASNAQLVPELEYRLELYRRGQPFRDRA